MKLRAMLNPEPGRYGPIALLIVRLATGAMIAPHGYYKALGGPAALAGGLAAGGFPVPLLSAWCLMLAELVGGIFMVLGLVTRPAAAVVSFTMVVAWASSHMNDLPNIGAKGGSFFEYPFLLSMTALAIAIGGPGAYSLDAVILRRNKS